MLQCMNKYFVQDFYTNVRNLKYNDKKLFLNLAKKTIINTYSNFLRKSHFRSLLMYINICYSNFNKPADNNQFYQPKITTLCISAEHPGFLFGKRVLK